MATTGRSPSHRRPTITAQLERFGPETRTITLTVGAELNLDLKLDVAGLEETLTVTGETPLVKSPRSEPSSVVTADQISALPVLDRNFLVLAQTLPGSAPLQRATDVRLDEIRRVRRPAQRLHDAHRRRRRRRHRLGQPDVNVTQDAVQEFKVFRNQFDAQYGAALGRGRQRRHQVGDQPIRAAAASTSAATRSSTRPTLSRRRSRPFNQTRVGGSFGGPIVKNRTHFFGAVEKLNVNTTTMVSLPPTNPFAPLENGDVPDADARAHGRREGQSPVHDQHCAFVRYAYDNQQLGGAKKPLHDVGGGLMLGTNSTDSAIRAHSIVVQDNWVLSSRAVNSFRVHYFRNYLATLPNSDTLGVVRPSFTWGQNSISPQIFDRWDIAFNDTFYLNLGHARLQGRRRLRVRRLSVRSALQREGRVHLQHRPAVQRQQPPDLSDLVHDAAAGVLRLQVDADCRLRRRTNGRSRPRPPSTPACARPRHEHADQRVLQRPAEGPVLRAARPVPRRRRRRHLPRHVAAAARRDLRRQRQRIAGAARRLGPLRDAQPAVVLRPHDEPDDQQLGVHHRSERAQVLSGHQRRARRQEPDRLCLDGVAEHRHADHRRLQAAFVAEHHRRVRLAAEQA